VTEELAERATCPAIKSSPLRTSAEQDKFAEAFAAAQGEFENPQKSKTATVKTRAGDEYTYQYADIADGLAEARKKLSAHGLFFTQVPVIDVADMNIVTRICHKSGQWIEGDYPVCRIGDQHQLMGGALTYAKRQALFSMIGIAGEDDIDAGTPANNPAPTKTNTSTPVRGRGEPKQAKAAEPPVERMLAGESAIAAHEMLAKLAETTKREEVLKWAQDHKDIKPRLQPPDAKRVEDKFLEHQRSLKAS
jgi:hypothetical protein